MFFGYYLSALIMVAGEHGLPVPELARRITAGNPGRDPAAALAGVLADLAASGIALGDVITDSGYSHRLPATWANPLRAVGAELVQDLHPATAARREPTRARSSPTEISTARKRPGLYWN